MGDYREGSERLEKERQIGNRRETIKEIIICTILANIYIYNIPLYYNVIF